MQTSESGISAKSLRGRDSTRKQDSSEKVRGQERACISVFQTRSPKHPRSLRLLLGTWWLLGFYISMVYRHINLWMYSSKRWRHLLWLKGPVTHMRNCELNECIINFSEWVLARWGKWLLQQLGTVSSCSRKHNGQTAFGSLSSCSWVFKFCLCVCGACVSVLRFGVLAAESFCGTWSVFVCPLTGQCPHGLSCLPSLSLCKYWMAARGGVATKILSSCWGWVAEGNPTCRLWQCLGLLFIQVIE